MTERLGPRPARKGIALVSLAAAALATALVPRVPGAWAALVIGVAAFSNDLSIATSWNTCTELGGKYAGTVAGQMNTWGALGGFVSPVLIGYLLDLTHKNWDITFYLASGVYAVGFLCWLALDPVQPIFASDTAGRAAES